MKVYNLEQWELWQPTTPYVFILAVGYLSALISSKSSCSLPGV